MKNNVIWFTGQSGAGKTTVVKELLKEFNAVMLDGDSMRASISLGAGFTREERREHNLRVARLAKELSKQEILVFVSVIAPMEEARKEIEEICDPTWIYVKRTIAEREGHFYEEPKDVFTVDHDVLDVKASVDKITKFIINSKEIGVAE